MMTSKGSVSVGKSGMARDDPKLLREKAAQCQAFARSAQLADVAEMLSRVAEDFLARALQAEQRCCSGNQRACVC
jgi:hypothetical protein